MTLPYLPRYRQPSTELLEAVGALTVYAVDTLLMKRPRYWNYRLICL